MSTPRFEHGVARIGEQILAFGGFDASYDCLTKASFKVLYQSKLLFQRWMSGTQRRRHGSLLALNSKLEELSLQQSLSLRIQPCALILRSSER